VVATESEIRGAAGMTGDARTDAVNLQQSLIVSNEVRQWVKEGRVYQAGEGVLTTPATFTATALVRQTPNFMIRVPAGMVIIPIMGLICYEATGGAGEEILISACNNDPGTATIVATTPVNVNTRFSLVPSQVLAYNTCTGATGTAPTGVVDLYRVYEQVDHDAIAGAPTPPFIYNPFHGQGQECVIGSNGSVHAFLAYYVNGTSSTGFSIFTWAEFTYPEYYGS
jgi:hypothetical protein